MGQGSKRRVVGLDEDIEASEGVFIRVRLSRKLSRLIGSELDSLELELSRGQILVDLFLNVVIKVAHEITTI